MTQPRAPEKSPEKGDLAISVELEGDRLSYRPGDTLTGHVLIYSADHWQARFGEVTLFYRTTGRGDSDTGVARRDTLFEPGRHIPPSFEHRLSWKMPVMPWTYWGSLIKLNWTIGLYVRAEGGREQVVELPLILHPLPHRFPLDRL